ncbi:zinc finger protein 70-like isoform X2 [Galleria mellonella]|uniref:Zinc finger protein 70-like isoform X2 n=1 Tax=Galleria mellonella TaxID=7137 RepID=A0ABM3MAV0_GALME|nr:zinc finger protein 70-like isoform X2 [Galleria mellonella]
MEEYSIRKMCCTCLSKDRKLYQLCRVSDGVNNLYLLLTFDSEAYREGFYKDAANLFVCWECKAVMCRIRMFRQQACIAQKELSSIADGRTSLKLDGLSKLTFTYKNSYDQMITETKFLSDNFIDCGLMTDVKTESEEDIPLSELHSNYMSDAQSDIAVRPNTEKPKVYTKKKKKIKGAKKNGLSCDGNKKYFTINEMDEVIMLESREKRKLAVTFADAAFKCDTCIEAFKTEIGLNEHNLDLHTEKPNHTQCTVCLTYVINPTISEHKRSHYYSYQCHFCDYICYTQIDISRHLKSGHAMKNVVLPVNRKKGQRKTPEVLRPGSKPRRNQAMMDKRTPYGYLCTECDKYFENKNQRWKHVQRYHREGYKCPTCGKRFAFKNNLSRHEQLHRGPPPREQCPVCLKMVRVDLVRVHARIHSARQRYTCAECDKCFVSRASYEHHLKYTQAHAAVDILKYKCSMCDKGYRSRGELRDHVNYQHMGKTQHKCPVCGKALATRRCITRHVRRAHHGLKESARDKICQQCGKAFRDKKGLREHEFIHTGERPLSCEICGCTFRQSASLYTHRKRVHKIYPQKKNVELLESTPAGGS